MITGKLKIEYQDEDILRFEQQNRLPGVLNQWSHIEFCQYFLEQSDQFQRRKEGLNYEHGLNEGVYRVSEIIVDQVPLQYTNIITLVVDYSLRPIPAEEIYRDQFDYFLSR